MREIRTLRATWRGLETWCGSGLPGHTGAPALDPTWESPEVKVLRATRQLQQKAAGIFSLRLAGVEVYVHGM